MSFSLKDYKKIRTPFVFFDETGSINSTGERFFGLGMMKCMQPYFLDSNIRHLRKARHSRLKQAFIKSIIDASLSTPGIQFSAMIINKDNVNFATQFSNNPYEAYQDFSEQLLISSIRDNEVQYEIKVLKYLQRKLQLKTFCDGSQSKKFRVFEYNKKGPSSLRLTP